jgi:transposase-like protein
MRKLLKKQGYAPDVLVTDKLRSYCCARRELGLSARHEQGLRKNNRRKLASDSARRERKMPPAATWPRCRFACAPVYVPPNVRLRYGGYQGNEWY